MLIAEHGTRWGRWMQGLAEAGVSVTVVIQRSREPAASFAQRVGQRADALCSSKRLPPTIVFVASRRIDPIVERCRATMARTLVRSLTRWPRPKPSLLLACDRSASQETIVDMKRVAVRASAECALQLGCTVRVAGARATQCPSEAHLEDGAAARPSMVPPPPDLPLPAA